MALNGTRGVSTVLDVALALLLVSASVVVVLSVAPATAPDRADARETAALLFSAGASVPYERSSGVARANGTVAGLLADAAVVRTRERDRGRFVAAVRAAAERTLRSVSGPAHVSATWRPYVGARGGRVAAGSPPPPGVDVDAVTLSVPLDERLGRSPDAENDRRSATRLALAVAVRRRPACRPAPAEDCPALAGRLLGRLRRALDAPAPPPGADRTRLRADRVVITVRTWSR